MGKEFLLLTVAAMLAALVTARHFELGVPATAVTVILTLPPSYLACKAFIADRKEADPITVDEALEGLAVWVKAQWANEEAVWRVNDPRPLSVAWEGVGGELAEKWLLLTELAESWPDGPPGDRGLWATDAAGLAGQDADIVKVFSDQVPTRRLVILGEPGAGKTVLLIRLLQGLISRRGKGARVPVLFSLASWDPHQPLETWMANQLRRNHPGLTSPVPASIGLAVGIDEAACDLALYLLKAGHILPLLDGFDELPPARHATALAKLNLALSAGQPLVMTSRTAPYLAALTRTGTTAPLNGAAAIRLLPLEAAETSRYLLRDAGGQHTPAAERWNTVITHLGSDSPVGKALANPLAVFLARTIYNPHTDEPPDESAHPDDLCETALYPDHTAILTHLFQAYIPAAYSSHQPRPPRWTGEQAHAAFVFLATFQQNHCASSPNLMWWALPRALPRRSRNVTVGLLSALASGLTVGLAVGLTDGLLAALFFGLPTAVVFGLVWGLTFGLEADSATPSLRLRWSTGRFLNALAAGLAAGGMYGLAAGVMGGLTAGLAIGIANTLVFGIGLGLVNGLGTQAPHLTTVTQPIALLASDRRAFIMLGLALGFVPALVAGIVFGAGFGTGIVGGLVSGLGCWIVIGPVAGLLQTAWPYFEVARIYLTLRRKIPLDLMAFLQDAHERRGVLRQVGAVYQFRHIDLQRHLAQ
ncbi:NACHT domain-containing protein [Streptomyces sp. NBC_00191]|uniref:NACHT domain-containing protein n=1 Tax=Streptomyces sp. NBC_00191 TaxID=2975674 RepID=UPI00324DF3CD